MMRLSVATRRKTVQAFALIEILLALVIMGIAVATILRSFTLSMSAIRRNDATTQATLLAEHAVQMLEADPPAPKSRVRGDFSDLGFPRYGYEVETTSEKIKYRIKTNTRINNLRDLKIARLNITYESPNGDLSVPADAYVVLPSLERFSYESKRANELFTVEEGI